MKPLTKEEIDRIRSDDWHDYASRDRNYDIDALAYTALLAHRMKEALEKIANLPSAYSATLNFEQNVWLAREALKAWEEE